MSPPLWSPSVTPGAVRARGPWFPPPTQQPRALSPQGEGSGESPLAPPSVLGLARRGRRGAPGPEEAAGPAADEEEPVELRGEQQRGAQVDVGRDGERHCEQGQAGVPPIGPVQIGEEQHPAAEEAEQHQGAVHLVQQRVLLLVLREGAGQRAGGGVRAQGRAPGSAPGPRLPAPPTSLPFPVATGASLKAQEAASPHSAASVLPRPKPLPDLTVCLSFKESLKVPKSACPTRVLLSGSYSLRYPLTWMRILPRQTKGVLTSAISKQPRKKSPLP